MGMLMHHTWLEQQKAAEKPVKESTKEVAEKAEPEIAPAKKTVSKRKGK